MSNPPTTGMNLFQFQNPPVPFCPVPNAYSTLKDFGFTPKPPFLIDLKTTQAAARVLFIQNILLQNSFSREWGSSGLGSLHPSLSSFAQNSLFLPQGNLQTLSSLPSRFPPLQPTPAENSFSRTAPPLLSLNNHQESFPSSVSYQEFALPASLIEMVSSQEPSSQPDLATALPSNAYLSSSLRLKRTKQTSTGNSDSQFEMSDIPLPSSKRLKPETALSSSVKKPNEKTKKLPTRKATNEEREAAAQEYIDGKKCAYRISKDYAKNGIKISETFLKYAKRLVSLKPATEDQRQAALQECITSGKTPYRISKNYAENGINISESYLRFAKNKALLKPSTKAQRKAAVQKYLKGKKTTSPASEDYAEDKVNPLESLRKLAEDELNPTKPANTNSEKAAEILQQEVDMILEFASQAKEDAENAVEQEDVEGKKSAYRIAQDYAAEGVYIPASNPRNGSQGVKRKILLESGLLRLATQDERDQAKKEYLKEEKTAVQISRDYAEQGIYIPESTLRSARQIAEREKSLASGAPKDATQDELNEANEEYLKGEKSATQICQEYAAQGIRIPEATLRSAKRIAERERLLESGAVQAATEDQLNAAKQEYLKGKKKAGQISRKYAAKGIHIPESTLRSAKRTAKRNSLFKSGKLRIATNGERSAAKQRCLRGEKISEISQDYAARGVHIAETTLRAARNLAEKTALFKKANEIAE